MKVNAWDNHLKDSIFKIISKKVEFLANELLVFRVASNSIYPQGTKDYFNLFLHNYYNSFRTSSKQINLGTSKSDADQIFPYFDTFDI